MVAVRSMGLSFESLIGVMDSDGRKTPIVSPGYLKMLVQIGNERFLENAKRIARFLDALRAETEDKGDGPGRSKEEEKEARREMKRAAGLKRQADATDKKGSGKLDEVEAYLEGLEGDTNLS
jgi:tRNA wybutosine-synthesizing protein 3